MNRGSRLACVAIVGLAVGVYRGANGAYSDPPWMAIASGAIFLGVAAAAAAIPSEADGRRARREGFRAALRSTRRPL